MRNFKPATKINIIPELISLSLLIHEVDDESPIKFEGYVSLSVEDDESLENLINFEGYENIGEGYFTSLNPNDYCFYTAQMLLEAGIKFSGISSEEITDEYYWLGTIHGQGTTESSQYFEVEGSFQEVMAYWTGHKLGTEISKLEEI